MLGLLIAGYYFGIAPAVRAQTQSRKQLEQSQRLRELAPALESENEELTQELERLCEKFKQSYTLHVGTEQPVLEMFSLLLERRHLEMTNFREEPRTNGNAIQVDLRVKGMYENMVYLLSDLDVLERPTKITSFQLNATDEYGETCAAQLQLIVSNASRFPTID